jgi:hypothetical protein
MSQNPHTKDYIMVLSNNYFEFHCLTCDEQYIHPHYYYKWCKSCQISYLKENFEKWTSGNERINNFIQEMQSKIENYYDTVTEWIPYDKFDNVEEMAKYDFTTFHLANWKDGPLEHNESTTKYERNPNKAVVLKYLYNNQNVDEFINEV